MKTFSFSRETIAVGIERPKTTLLFFDYLLFPQIPYILPSLDDAAFFFKVPRKFIRGFDDFGIPDFARNFAAKRLADIAGRNFGDSYIHLQNASPALRESFYSKVKKDFLEDCYTLDWIYDDEYLLDEYILLTSTLVNTFQNDFSITPVFRNKNQYHRVDSSERVCAFLDDFQKKMKIQNTNQVRPAIGYCLNGSIQIDEDDLDWKQVEEFRKDKHSLSKVRFHNWMQDFNDLSKAAIEDKVGSALHDYKAALKKHVLEQCTEPLQSFYHFQKLPIL